MVGFFVLLIAVGALLIAAALLNWDWLYGEELAHCLEVICGETAARWYTGLVGTAIIVIAVLFLIDK